MSTYAMCGQKEEGIYLQDKGRESSGETNHVDILILDF